MCGWKVDGCWCMRVAIQGAFTAALPMCCRQARLTSQPPPQLAIARPQVPPYFVLILRTFSVIEGIALQSDPDYSIVRECFPYLSRRLLTDDNPRVRAALKQLLFAGEDHISLERLERLVQGASAFTVDGLQGLQGHQAAPALAGHSAAGVPAPAARAASAPRPLIDSTAKEILEAVFSTRPGGTYVQQLLVEEAVSTVDAAGRQLAAVLLGPALGNIAAAQSRGQLGGGAQPSPALALLNRCVG